MDNKVPDLYKTYLILCAVIRWREFLSYVQARTVLTLYCTANKTHIGCSFAHCLNPVALLPYANGEHVQNRSSLNPTEDHYKTDYAKWIEGQLGSQNIHALLEWSFWSFFCLHHLKNFTKFRLLSCVYYNPLKEQITNICKIKKLWEELMIPAFLQMFQTVWWSQQLLELQNLVIYFCSLPILVLVSEHRKCLVVHAYFFPSCQLACSPSSQQLASNLISDVHDIIPHKPVV